MPGNFISLLVWFSVAPFFYNLHNSENIFQRIFHTILYSYTLFVTTLWWQIFTLSKNIPQVLGKYSNFIGFLAFLLMNLILTIPFFIIPIFLELYHRKGRDTSLQKTIFFYALLYTTVEVLREMGDLAFTGGRLADALYNQVGILQFASIGGAIGLTFIVALSNAFIAFFPERNKTVVISIILFLVLLLNFLITSFLPEPVLNEEKDFKILAFQTNIPQGVKYNQDVWGIYVDVVQFLEKTKDLKADIIAFPEALFLMDIRNTSLEEALKELIKQRKTPFLFGIPRIEKDKYFNSAILYSDQGKILKIYDKIRLTPFAEFLPYPVIFRNFSFLRLLNYYEPGKDFSPMRFKDHTFATQICFESYFSEVSANMVKKGAKSIIIITNDGWFDKSAGLIQHFSKAILRAVENRRYVLQVSNTGITGIIDKYGRIIYKLKEKEEGYGIFNLKEEEKKSLFTRYRKIINTTFIVLTFILALF